MCYVFHLDYIDHVLDFLVHLHSYMVWLQKMIPLCTLMSLCSIIMTNQSGICFVLNSSSVMKENDRAALCFFFFYKSEAFNL